MSNKILRLSTAWACMAAATLLTACMGSDSDKSDGGSRFEIATTATLLRYDEDDAKMVTRQKSYYCDSTELETSTYTDSSRYQVANGKLKVWTDGQCYTNYTLNGSSSTLIGKWSGSLNDVRQIVPSAFRPIGCDPSDELPVNEQEYLFENAKVNVDITEEQVKTSISGDFCVARYLGLLLSGDTTGLGSGCSKVTWKDTTDDVVTKAELSAKVVEGTRIEGKFTYAGTTCALRMRNPLVQVTASTECTVEEDDNETAFGDCVESTGFFESDTASLPKRAEFKARARALSRLF